MGSKVLKLLVTTFVLHMLVSPISQTIAVVLGYAILFLSIALPFDLFAMSKGEVNYKQLRLFCGFVVIIIGAFLFSFLGLDSSEYETLLKAMISFVAFLASIMISPTEYGDNDLQFFYKINRFAAIVLILYTVLPLSFRYTIVNAYGQMQFTLSMGNPNATASKVMFIFFLLMIQFEQSISKKDKKINLCLMIGLLYVLFWLESRTALLCSIIGAVLMFVKYRVTVRMANLIWLVPLLFIPIQLIFEKVPLLKFLGKSLASGRNTMFAKFISQITESPFRFILGDFGMYQLENYHNIFFSLVFNFGIVGLTMYYFFWRIESKNIELATSNISNVAWIAIMMFITQSSAESATMSGAFVYSVMIIFLARLSKDQIGMSKEKLYRKQKEILNDRSAES